jgi:dipeptidyl-peptidase III
MKKIIYSILTVALVLPLFQSCNTAEKKEKTETVSNEEFEHFSETFADIQILRYKANGFESLTPKQKELLYYLYEAANSGRDIIYDQNCKENLRVRKTIENIVENYKGDKNTDDYNKFLTYAKRVWFSNGIHHHYSTRKLIPDFSQTYFAELIKNTDGGSFPLKSDENLESFISNLTPVIFDPNLYAKRVNQEEGIDMVANSANNFHEGLTQKEVEAYYASIIDKNDPKPISYGLNSKLVKENGKVVEKVWKVGGMYTQAIEKIVFWLEKAVNVAETEQQRITLQKLVDYYKTGNLRTWDEYNIEWVKDIEASVDVVNGFIEVYGDPMGYKATYESVVSFRDIEATKRIAAIAKEAQWFEDNSPLIESHKKKNVTGISAKVITVVAEGGDCSPSTPIGINLPNAEWIREGHGSKSVSLGNITEAYDNITAKGSSTDEFYINDEIKNRIKKYASLSGMLHTDMHEVIGHASGQINPGIGDPAATLKNYASTLEEARADLVALYYIMDQKLVDMGVMPSLEVGMAEYDTYINNGLFLQLRRLEAGENLEEAHMRNRQLNAAYVYKMGEKDNVIEKVVKDGKTYFVINDYQKLRMLFGDLLREIQRIKSEGDYKSGRDLVESFGVKVDEQLKAEVKARYEKLKIAPYNGFIQPKLVPVMDGDKIKDVKIEYPTNFTQQMLELGKNYGYLPVYN